VKAIDRVIFSLTDNPDYLGFWNFISKLYRTKFDITPTLFFSGDDHEFDRLTSSKVLSDEYGEVHLLTRSRNVAIESKDWSCVWGAFYGASKFNNERCMISGIDQIPLGDRFIRRVIDSVREDKYVVSLSDGYTHENADFPSSHHIALGSQFRELYSIDDDWHREVEKLFNWRFNLPRYYEGMSLWGIDEAYSSSIIRKKMNDDSCKIKVDLKRGFQSEWGSRRVDRSNGRLRVSAELLAEIKSGELSEYHSVRPFEANFGIEMLQDLMPTFENKL